MNIYHKHVKVMSMDWFGQFEIYIPNRNPAAK